MQSVSIFDVLRRATGCQKHLLSNFLAIISSQQACEKWRNPTESRKTSIFFVARIRDIWGIGIPCIPCIINAWHVDGVENPSPPKL